MLKQYIFREKTRSIKKTGLFFVLFLVILQSIPLISVAYGNTNIIHKDSASTFTISKLSPYLTDDTLGIIGITSNLENITNIKISIIKSTNTRSELFNFVDKPSNKNVISKITIPIDNFQLTEIGTDNNLINNFETNFSINSVEPESTNSLTLSKTGIYPVAIELLGDNNKKLDTQYSFITYFPKIIFSQQAYSEKLNIVPVIINSEILKDEKIYDGSGALTKDGKIVQKEFNTTERNISNIYSINTPKSFLINGQYIDSFSQINSTSKQIPIVSFAQNPENTNNQYIADTYTPMNIVELNKITKKSVFLNSLVKTQESLTRSQIQTTPKILFTKSVSNQTLKDLSNSVIKNIIVGENTFSSTIPLSSLPLKIETDKTTLNMATYRTDFMNHLNINATKDSQSNILNAFSSVVALEEPSNSRFLIIPLDISKISFATISSFLSSLENNPLTRSTTISDAFVSIKTNGKLSTKIAKTEYGYIPKDSLTLADYNDTRNRADTIESLYGSNSLEARIAENIFYRVTSSLETKTSIAKDIEKLKVIIDNARDFISLPEKRTITLTSNESTIPVTVKNTTNKQITVMIKLKSDKLVFTESDSYKVALNSLNTTIRVPVKTRTSGSFPIEIKMSSVENGVVLASQRATIRSTSFSGVGLGIMVGSFIFLVIWWLLHYKKNKKNISAKILNLHKETLV